MFKKIDWKERVKVLGHDRPRRELLWNGIAFILIQISYNVFDLVSQIPAGFKDMTKEQMDNVEVHRQIIIPVILFLIGYWLISRAIYNTPEKMIEKYGTTGFFLKRITLILSLIFLTLLLEVGAAFLIIIFI